jgi:polyisoprenoid-binding protein YceI
MPATPDRSPVGFKGEARINRHDFQVSWNGQLENAGVIVGDEVVIRIDIEALPEADINRIMKK